MSEPIQLAFSFYIEPKSKLQVIAYNDTKAIAWITLDGVIIAAPSHPEMHTEYILCQ